jgi:hypothetical protein
MCVFFATFKGFYTPKRLRPRNFYEFYEQGIKSGFLGIKRQLNYGYLVILRFFTRQGIKSAYKLSKGQFGLDMGDNP